MIAADGSMAELHKEILCSQSETFREIILLSRGNCEILCNNCKNREVLNNWVYYLVHKELKVDDWNLKIERVLIELIHIADYFLIQGMLLDILMIFNQKLNEVNALQVYNSLPQFYLCQEEQGLGRYIQRMVELLYVGEIFDSPRFLNMDPIKFVLIASTLTDQKTLLTVMETYTHCNSETLNEEILVTKEVVHETLESFRVSIDQKSLKNFLKMNLNDFDFYKVQKGLDKLFQATGRCYQGMNDLIRKMISNDLDEISNIIKNAQDLIIFRLESRIFQKTIQVRLIYQIYKEDKKVSQCAFEVHNMGEPVSGIGTCVHEGKVLMWNRNKRSKDNQGIAIDLDSNVEDRLPCLDSKFNLIYWTGHLLALNSENGKNLIYNIQANAWEELRLGDIFPLIGSPLVVGDRLFILPPEDDWIRLIRPYQRRNIEDEYEFDYVQDFIVPPTVDEEPLDSPNRFFRIKVDDILAAQEQKGRIYLVRSENVLIYDKDNLRFLEERPLPEIAYNSGYCPVHKVTSLNGNLLFLFLTDDFLEVHVLDLENWSFQRILRDDYEDGYSAHNDFGFLEQHLKDVDWRIGRSYVNIR